MIDNQEVKDCPYCREKIKANAIKCRYCYSALDGKSVREVELTKANENPFNSSEKSESASNEAYFYCRNCGAQVSKKAEVCTSCGVRPLNGKKYCQECGSETNEKQEICIKCGCRLKTLGQGIDLSIDTKEMVYPSNPPKSPGLAAFLSLLIVGVGQLYLGQTVKGIAWFIGGIILAVITSGILGPVILIAAIVDAYRIGKKMANGNPVGKWEFF